MNGAVSHELRNPLSSLIAGIDLLNSYINNLKYLIECLDHTNEDVIRISKVKIKKVLDNMETNSRKMNSSSKFIDYFVHDMLDYTVLSNDKKNFIKKNAEFSLNGSIQEIIQIMNDKIEMKNLKLRIDIPYVKVLTDQKRLQ